MRVYPLSTLLALPAIAWTVAAPVSAADQSPPASAPSAAPPTIIVVRHAEKADDSSDPALSETGRDRAQALAGALEHAGLDAAYASQYRRTRLTALPAAEAAGLTVRTEAIEGDIDAWAQGFAAEVVRQNPGKTVLVAGHSNTLPPLVAALCRCDVEPLTEDDYDRLFIVNRAGGENPALIAARYGTE